MIRIPYGRPGKVDWDFMVWIGGLFILVGLGMICSTVYNSSATQLTIDTQQETIQELKQMNAELREELRKERNKK